MPASDEEALQSELKERFQDIPGFNDAFLNSCVRICQTFNVSGEDLFFKWEAVTFNMDRIITAKTSSDIEAFVKAAFLKAQKQQVQNQTRLASAARARPGMDPFYGRRQNQAASVSSPTPARQSRPATGNGNASAQRHKVTLVVDGNGIPGDGYKYMYEKISDRSETLDERIDDFVELIKKHYGLSELGDPGLSTDEEVVVVGRIVLDTEASASDGAKLNEASIHFESSRMMGAGTRIAVKFEPNVKIRGAPRGQGGIGLFPGAIVAFKGKNGGAGWFSVSEMFSLPPSSVQAVDKPLKMESSEESSFSMIAACGPYTSDSDLDFKPWKALMSKVKVEQPDVLLLLGPFLDCLHSKFESGDIDDFPDDIFRNIFEQDLLDFVSNTSPSPLVLVVPSVRDVQSDHAVFPQRPLQSNLLNSVNIKMLSNPARFSLNGLNVAVTSVDTLFHLKKEEFIKRADEVDPIPISETSSATDAMSNLCRHILYQRSFYPVFPSPLPHEVNLDVSHMKNLELFPLPQSPAPDVLIIPSRLRHFAKNVDDTMAVNPSYASKNMLASIFYGGEGEGPAAQRLKVTLVKT